MLNYTMTAEVHALSLNKNLICMDKNPTNYSNLSKPGDISIKAMSNF